MEVRILSTSTDSPADRPYATSFLLNGTVAVDAGCLGFVDSPEAQSAVRHILLTHSHSDHTATLPIMIENSFDPAQPAVVLHGLPETLDAIRKHIFNDVIWPDFIKLSRPERPFLILEEFMPEQPFEVEGLRILPVAVNHCVPTVGFVVEDDRSTVVFGADSGPTERIWEVAHRTRAPRSVFLEASFPNSMRWLADASAHLTPELFRCEVLKMPPMHRVFAVHIKRRFQEAVMSELLNLGMPNLIIGEANQLYEV